MKNNLLFEHEMRQAARTRQQRVVWLRRDQTKVVLRVRNKECVVAVWNKDRAIRTGDLENIRMDARVPEYATRIDDSRDGWHGTAFRWMEGAGRGF